MLYLFLAIIASTLIIVTFKMFDKYNINKLPAITTNYFVASLLGYLTVYEEVHFTDFPQKPWFIPALIVGFTLIIAFNFFAMSAQKAGVAITAIASRMSVVIPVMLGFFLFGDAAGILKIGGTITGLLAFYMTFKKEKGVEVDKRYIYLPFLLFLAVGLNDSMLKVSQHFFIDGEFVLFLATAFLVALIIGTAVSFFSADKFIFQFRKRNLIAGSLLGIFNWYSTFYFLRGMDTIPVSVIVPVYNVSVVALSTITGYLFFKERITRDNWIGVFLAVAAIIMIARG
jgi:drug/metabolite transporter (DMT)-like permease